MTAVVHQLIHLALYKPEAVAEFAANNREALQDAMYKDESDYRNSRQDEDDDEIDFMKED